MNNLTFKRKLDRLSLANEKYKKLLNECEDEYKKRFGHYPSDIDDDGWIDTYHIGIGSMSINTIEENAKLCLARRR